ncbi:MAG TPA: epoxyqueuosine reductase QueH [Firmicutes bacterium]|nr:epoxyqueuosine reductase QueH [Candidatus Fermentithermobacillaceae bacterium]
MRVLLHTCCGPCAIFPASLLEAEGFSVTLFFYNPNVFPLEEKVKRRDALASLAKEEGWTVVYDDAPYEAYESRVAMLERPRRCQACYLMRLEKTARAASDGRYDGFSTTLLVSPYQRHEDVRRIGEVLGNRFGVSFIYRDFRVGYRRGRSAARGKHIYMQNYCGCGWSLEERVMTDASSRTSL